MTTTFPTPVDVNRQRHPHTLYKFSNNATPFAVVLGNPNEYVNITGQLLVAHLTNEVGFSLLKSPDVAAGDEQIVTEFAGPVSIRATARIEGGIVTNTSYLGLLVDGDFSGGPIPLATIPDGQTDIAIQDGTELLTFTWLLEHARITPKTKLQIGLASSAATTLNLHHLTVDVVREIGANVGA